MGHGYPWLPLQTCLNDQMTRSFYILLLACVWPQAIRSKIENSPVQLLCLSLLPGSCCLKSDMSVGKIQVSGTKRYSCGMGLWEQEKMHQINTKSTHTHTYTWYSCPDSLNKSTIFQTFQSIVCIFVSLPLCLLTLLSKLVLETTWKLWDHQHPSTQLQNGLYCLIIEGQLFGILTSWNWNKTPVGPTARLKPWGPGDVQGTSKKPSRSTIKPRGTVFKHGNGRWIDGPRWI